jgi:hypothetical protein
MGINSQWPADLEGETCVSIAVTVERLRSSAPRSSLFHGFTGCNSCSPSPGFGATCEKYCRMPRPVRGIVWRYASQSRFGQSLVLGLKLGELLQSAGPG